MSAVLSLLTLIAGLLPQFGSLSSGAIGEIIATLVQILPTVAAEIEGVEPLIKNIIAALSSQTAVTADHLAQLQVIDAQVDQAFEDAATTAGASPATS